MTKRFKLIINLEANDAFDDNIEAIQYCLKVTLLKLSRINTFDELWHTKNVQDMNGNTIGYFNVKDEEK